MAERILIVDDDPWILRMVSTLLEKRGYAIFTAGDGEEALGRAEEVKPDLVVTDVMMPKMDGWELVRELRARPHLALIPVLFLTALNGEEDRLRGFRLGVFRDERSRAAFVESLEIPLSKHEDREE